MTIQFEQNVI